MSTPQLFNVNDFLNSDQEPDYMSGLVTGIQDYLAKNVDQNAPKSIQQQMLDIRNQQQALLEQKRYFI